MTFDWEMRPDGSHTYGAAGLWAKVQETKPDGPCLVTIYKSGQKISETPLPFSNLALAKQGAKLQIQKLSGNAE
jgi:hypothetical protein